MITDTLRKRLLEKDDPFTDILGQEQAKQAVKSSLLAGRHIIIIGPPGIGKTTLAKNISHLLGKGAPFIRIQGSPDLSVEDLLGDIDPVKALKFGPTSTEAFTKGKIFKADKGVLFFDELNRCAEKLQNALLQVLEEGAATIGSYDVDFGIDFLFIATMNPEDSSTEKLSDVLLDRFDLIYMGERREAVQRAGEDAHPDGIFHPHAPPIGQAREEALYPRDPGAVRALAGERAAREAHGRRVRRHQGSPALGARAPHTAEAVVTLPHFPVRIRGAGVRAPRAGGAVGGRRKPGRTGWSLLTARRLSKNLSG